MKQTHKVALGGVFGALALLCLVLTVFPYATYALPAIAGVMLIPIVIECGKRWALTVYAAVALLSLLVAPDLEAKVLFITLFGYYPVLKAAAETCRLRALEWGIKLGTFNVAAILSYAVLARLGFSLDSFTIDGVALPIYGFLLLFLAAGNVVFVLYDIAITRLLPLYFARFQPLFRRLFKG